jgi:hypothetical protein
MPILGTVASQFSGKSFSSFESISTVTVGSGGTSTIEFTSIPSTYAHLQIRGFVADNATNGNLQLKYNSTTLTRSHQIMGEGSGTPATDTDTVAAVIYNQRTNTGQFVVILDILNYANTTTNKTFRVLSGGDKNGAGRIRFGSGFLDSTSAISSLSMAFNSGGGTFPQYSHFALYGIKGA